MFIRINSLIEKLQRDLFEENLLFIDRISVNISDHVTQITRNPVSRTWFVQ